MRRQVAVVVRPSIPDFAMDRMSRHVTNGVGMAPRRMTSATTRYGDAVVVTPVPARRDSRILKQSLSLARAGFRSILFEGQQSSPQIFLPNVEIVALNGAKFVKISPGASSYREKLRRRITGGNASWIEAWAGFIAYLLYYLKHYVVGGLRHLPPASLYYLNEFSFFPAVWVKSKWHGAVIAYDARDYYVGIETDSTKTRFQKLVVEFGRLVEKCCVRKAQVFTTVGEGIATLLERQYGRRPEVIYNAHDETIDKNCEQTLRQRIGLEKDTPLAVIVGHAKPGQDISGTVGALSRLSTLHVALIGSGYREMTTSRDLQAEVAARIHYIEDLGAGEIVPLIRDADIALLIYYPRSENYKNALPNGFFQSVAAGLPLLYGALPEIRRVCQEYDFGVAVAPDDVDGLTELLTRVVHKSEWYEEQRQRSARAASSLTWQRAEAKLQRLLVDCLPQ
jgi:glycosyltransferase involved in cell wall biosynthesis